MGKLTILVLAILFAVITAKPHKGNVFSTGKNSLQMSWKTGDSPIARLSDHAFKRLLGEVESSESDNIKVKHIETADDIPDSFDARDQWPDCPSISSVKDQGRCNGCWAVTGASVASDRLCIASNANIKVNLSAENLLSCCSDCSKNGGCNGGSSKQGWEYIVNTGIVTGGDYGSDQGCQPYDVYPIGIHGNSDTAPCSNSCTNNDYDTSYNDDIHIGDSYYTLPNDVGSIQTEIMKYGPVHASFDVYGDFKSYSGGVYSHAWGAKKGRHAVRVIGWGTDNDSGTDYWLVINSWNRTWGEDGLFRMRRGTDECGFEDSMIAGYISS